MQLFVRNLNGVTVSLDVEAGPSTTVASLKPLIARSTSVPEANQRLLYGGRDLNDEESLSNYGIRAQSTLVLSSRLRGGEKKKRCQFALDATERCSNAALTMIGMCDKCQMRFCARHRLPEEHKCASLDVFKQEAFDQNRSKLEKESMAAGTNLHNVAF